MTADVIPWAVVVPTAEERSKTARELLDIAGHPHLVRTIHGGTSFEVPASVADEYQRRRTRRGKRGRAPQTKETPS